LLAAQATEKKQMTSWYYHLADMLLVLLSYLLLGRLLLAAIGAAQNGLVRAVGAATAPILAIVAVITPRMVPAPLLVLGALAWLYAARVLLRAGLAAAGVRLG
jgi:hypothetical protein